MRWLSAIPAGLIAAWLASIIVKVILWLTLLPFRVIEKVMGIGMGPIGRLMDWISIRIFAIDALAAVTTFTECFFFGYVLVVVSTMVSPATKKNFSAIAAGFMTFIFVLGTILSIIIGNVTAESVLTGLSIFLGAFSAFTEIRSRTDLENDVHEQFVMTNIPKIFISSSVLIMGLLLLLWTSRNG